jgi:hypothetical protein
MKAEWMTRYELRHGNCWECRGGMELVGSDEIRRKDEPLDANEDIISRALWCVKLERVGF